MKYFAINAGYRKTDVDTLFYYVKCNDWVKPKDVKKWFKETFTWLDVYSVVECDKERYESGDQLR